MKIPDHYQTLGITPFASDREVKQAYNKLLQEYHPDKKQGAQTFASKRFQAVMQAYETLKTSDRRAAYDELLKIQISNSKTADKLNRRNIRMAGNDNSEALFEESSFMGWLLKPFKKNTTTGV